MNVTITPNNENFMNRGGCVGDADEHDIARYDEFQTTFFKR